MASRKSTKTTTKKPVKSKSTTSKRSTKTAKSTRVAPSVESQSVERSLQSSNRVSPKTLKIVIVLAVLAGVAYLLKGLFVVALINNVPLTRIEVLKELESRYGQQVADEIVTNKLILQEAKKQGKLATNEQVEEEMNNIKASVEAQGMTFEDALSLQGTNEAKVRESILVYKSAQNLIADTISVSEEEVLGYFDENQALYEDKAYDDVKEEIKNQLIDQKLQSQLFTYIQDLKTNSKVQYFVEY